MEGFSSNVVWRGLNNIMVRDRGCWDIGLGTATTGWKCRVDLRVDGGCLVPRGVALGLWPAVGLVAASTICQDLTHVQVVGDHLLSIAVRIRRERSKKSPCGPDVEATRTLHTIGRRGIPTLGIPTLGIPTLGIPTLGMAESPRTYGTLGVRLHHLRREADKRRFTGDPTQGGQISFGSNPII